MEVDLALTQVFFMANAHHHPWSTTKSAETIDSLLVRCGSLMNGILTMRLRPFTNLALAIPKLELCPHDLPIPARYCAGRLHRYATDVGTSHGTVVTARQSSVGKDGVGLYISPVRARSYFIEC